MESTQYEVGAKYQLPGDALLTLALFQIDKGLEYENAAGYYVQDGRQVHRGVELNLGGAVTKNLRALAGVAYLDAEVEKTTDLSILGKRPQGVPEWQGNLYLDYDLADLLRGFSVNGGIYYGGAKYIDGANSWEADAYWRFDAGLRYTHSLTERATATYRLNVENLFDEVYLANSTWGALGFGAPVTLKFSASFSY